MRHRFITRSLYLLVAGMMCLGSVAAEPKISITNAVNTPNRSTRLAGVSLDGSKMVYVRDAPNGTGGGVFLLDLNATTDSRVRRRESASDRAKVAGISADGRYLGIGLRHDFSGMIQISLIDLTGMTPAVGRLEPNLPIAQLTSLKVSPDGSVVVATITGPDELWIWKPSSDELQRLPTSVTLARGGQVFSPDSARFVFTRPAGISARPAVFELEVATWTTRQLTCNSMLSYKSPTYDWDVPVSVVAAASTTAPAPGGSVIVRVPSGASCGSSQLIASLPGSLVVDAAAAPMGSGIVITSDHGPLPGYDVLRVDEASGDVTNLTMASYSLPPLGAWPDREGDIAAFTHATTGTVTGISAVNMWTPTVGTAIAAPPPAQPFDIQGYACYTANWSDAHGDHVGMECPAEVNNSAIRDRSVLLWHSMRGESGLERSFGPFVMPLSVGARLLLDNRFDTTCEPSQSFLSQVNAVQTDASMDDVWYMGAGGFTTCECLAPLGCF